MDQRKLVQVQEKISGSSKKSFCPNGSVDPEYHFYIDPSEWNEKNLIPQLKISHYPLLVAPSQSGKTTRVNKLLDQLKDKYLPIYIDLQTIVRENMTPNQFWEQFLQVFMSEVEKITKNNLEALKPESISVFTLFVNNFKYKQKYYGDKHCILVLDEIDMISKINDSTRKDFLTILRALKQQKIRDGSNCLHSVLGITNWVGDYINDTLGGSPFNISNKILCDYFTLDETKQLFGQYESQEKFTFDEEIIQNIYEQTTGAQGLTNLFGQYISEWIKKNNNTPPTLSEWKSLTYDFQFLYYSETNSSNLRKMLTLLISSKKAESCQKALITFFSGQNLGSLYREEAHLLINSNILRETSQRLEIASPFIDRFLKNKLKPKEPSPQFLPCKESKLDIVQIVKAVIENINIMTLAFGQKLSNNNCISTERPGCKEPVYRVEFYYILKQLFPTLLCKLEENVPLKDFKDFKSEKLQSNQLPSKAISCDMLMQLDKSNYLIEHGVNLSLSKDSSYNTTSTLWHHVYRQGELYHFGLKAKETWLINWTTVGPEKLGKDGYWFPKSSTVKTMYIYHSSDFLTFKIYTENQQEIIVKKENPIQFGEKKRKLNQLEEIEESIPKIPKVQDKKNVILRKYGQKKGGTKIQLPEDLEKLLEIGNEYLKVKGIKIRESLPIEAEIVDINSIQDNQILYFTTEEDEKEFQE